MRHLLKFVSFRPNTSREIIASLSVFKNACKALKPGGVFVIDFFNSEKIERSLHDDYVEKRGAIHFHIQKKNRGYFQVLSVCTFPFSIC